MKNLLKSLIFLFLVILVLPVFSQDATQIVQKSQDLVNGKSSKGNMKMTIVRSDWTREVTMKSWSLGGDYYMVYILSPARDKGQVFMKRNTDMWNWMPAINRMIKIPPSMMSQSWMGSDFTNNDLMKLNSYVVDYNHKILGDETIGGYDCYKIELLPKENAAVVWGKIILWVAKTEYYQMQFEFFDEDMKMVNKEICSDVIQMGDRKLPSKLVMTPLDKEGQKTIIEMIDVQFNVSDINESFFSQQNMKRVR